VGLLDHLDIDEAVVMGTSLGANTTLEVASQSPERLRGMTSSAWQTSARVALFGMIVNSIFAVAKILGGVFGHAYVLIADGIESGLDIAGSFVIWSGLKV